MRCLSFFHLACLFLFSTSPLHSLIIHVPGDSTTIQRGINGAEDGDTVMVHQGTYYEYDIDFLGKAITVMSTDPEDSVIVASTVIDGDSLGSVFYFHSGEDSTSLLTGLTITGGYDVAGGGIYCYWFSSPTASKNVIVNNGAINFGGGIYCWYSSPIISENRITENLAGEDGGGIFCRSSSSPLISNNIIRGNSASHDGGGIFCNESSPTITGNAIEDNTALSGAGIVCEYSSSIISGNLITDNTATSKPWSFGGGILSSNSSLTISKNSITGNSAYSGGGISCLGFSPLISDNNISGNSATGSGGGINVWPFSSPTLSNNSISGNSAEWGGGIDCSLSFPTLLNNIITENTASTYGGGLRISLSWHSSVAIMNTIFWNNDAPLGEEIYITGTSEGPSTLTISYSNVAGGSTSVYIDSLCTLDWGLGMIDSDPLFRDSGGGNFHLMSIECGYNTDSPCIDAGDPAVTDSILDCDHGLGTTRSDIGAYGGRGEGPTVSIRGVGGKPDMLSIPRAFNLHQNYPNPFNPSTTIEYAIPEGVGNLGVLIAVYDLRGRLVKRLVDGEQGAGHYRVHWDGKDEGGQSLGSGVYLLAIKAGTFESRRKMVMVR